MVVTHSKDYWNGYVNEPADKYAGGSAGVAAYACTEPANPAALTAQNYPFNEAQQFPQKEYQHEAVKAAGQAADVVQSFVSGVKILPGKKVQYVQNNTWITKTIGYLGKEGALPYGSWCEVYKDGQRVMAAYGCYITNYEMAWDGRSFLKETVEYMAFDVKATTEENFAAGKAWEDDPVMTHKDIILTVDGTEYECKSGTLRIKPAFISDDDRQTSDFLHKFPYFKEFETIEVEFALYAYDENKFITALEGEDADDTVDLFTITIAGVYTTTLTLSNMKVKNESLNVREMPEKGLKLYTGVFEAGGDVSPALA